MKINKIKIRSKNYEVKANRTIKYIIIHYTGMKNQTVAIKRLQSKVAKVSTHYLISKKGRLIQMVDEQDVAWHAGKSKWGKDIDLNSKSIGIELVNNGYENFPIKQMKKLAFLLNYLLNKYNVNKKYVLGHSHIAPKRKSDPGPLFPWSYLARKGLSKFY